MDTGIGGAFWASYRDCVWRELVLVLREDLLLRFRSRLTERTGESGSPMGSGRGKDGIDGMLGSRRGPTGIVGVGAAS